VPKPKIKSWSVAAQKIADQATDPKKLLPQQIIEQEIERAHDQAVADVYGADWNSTLMLKGGPKSKASVRPFGCFESLRRRPKHITQQSAVGAARRRPRPNASESSA
jgi:hypothetical protein